MNTPLTAALRASEKKRDNRANKNTLELDLNLSQPQFCSHGHWLRKVLLEATGKQYRRVKTGLASKALSSHADRCVSWKGKDLPFVTQYTHE
jgi:hypothetical protein